MKMTISKCHKAPWNLSLIAWALLTMPLQSIFAAEEHEGDAVTISNELAAELGIETELAGPGIINLDILLYGRTMPDPQGVSHVFARYPGMIVSMQPTLGDSVEVGEVLAVIEANSSLQNYQVLSPLTGIVVEKHANPGELATSQSLLTIANYNNIWVDLTVFPGDSQQIRSGMPVTISMENLSAESTIRYINPSQGESPTVIARVPLENANSTWTPGLLVEGYVHIDSSEVAVAVKNSQVVFVLNDETYVPRTITIGRSDPISSEVLSGLEPGERYVVSNSYILKADLEKEGTEHEH